MHVHFMQDFWHGSKSNTHQLMKNSLFSRRWQAVHEPKRWMYGSSSCAWPIQQTPKPRNVSSALIETCTHSDTHTNERPWTPYISTAVHGYDKRVTAFLMTINIVYLLHGNGSETRLGRRGWPYIGSLHAFSINLSRKSALLSFLGSWKCVPTHIVRSSIIR